MTDSFAPSPIAPAADEIEEGPARATDNRRKMPEPELVDRPMTGERYWSKDFAQKEWDGVWSKVWQVGALERDLREAGDFVTFAIGHESILMVRGDDATVRAFYNVCQHRGNRLVEAEAGSLKAFTCAYHQWRYALDGTLQSVPDVEDFRQGSPCGKINLQPVRCESFAGFLWYTLDPDAVPLREFLGEVAEHIESYRMEGMTRTHWVTIEGDFNWKCVQDNFNESYHVEFVHPEVRFVMETSGVKHQQDLYPSGHARIIVEGCRPDPRFAAMGEHVRSMMHEELTFWDLTYEEFIGREQEMRAALRERKRAAGKDKGYDFSSYNDGQLTDHFHYSIFPNLSLSLKPDGCIFLRANPHPTDPTKCLFDMWYFTRFPEGVTEYHSHTMKEMVSIDDDVPHVIGPWPQVSAGPGIDQDVRIWNAQQKGLQSKGYRGGYLAWQERRVRYFHQNLDRYIAAIPERA